MVKLAKVDSGELIRELMSRGLCHPAANNILNDCPQHHSCL